MAANNVAFLAAFLVRYYRRYYKCMFINWANKDACLLACRHIGKCLKCHKTRKAMYRLGRNVGCRIPSCPDMSAVMRSPR